MAVALWDGSVRYVGIQVGADPVGQVSAEWTVPNGMQIRRVRTPLGVIGVIFESRPNVAADAGALTLKSGNAVILRGGSDSFRSCRAILASIARGLREASCHLGIPIARLRFRWLSISRAAPAPCRAHCWPNARDPLKNGRTKSWNRKATLLVCVPG